MQLGELHCASSFAVDLAEARHNLVCRSRGSRGVRRASQTDCGYEVGYFIGTCMFKAAEL